MTRNKKKYDISKLFSEDTFRLLLAFSYDKDSERRNIARPPTNKLRIMNELFFIMCMFIEFILLISKALFIIK